jgi:hypothetical protein
MARHARGWLLAVVGILYLLSIPWYREAGAVPGRWLGLPDWVAVALVCYTLAAVANAVAWLLTDVPDPPEQGGRDAAGARPDGDA